MGKNTVAKQNGTHSKIALMHEKIKTRRLYFLLVTIKAHILWKVRIIQTWDLKDFYLDEKDQKYLNAIWIWKCVQIHGYSSYPWGPFKDVSLGIHLT